MKLKILAFIPFVILFSLLTGSDYTSNSTQSVPAMAQTGPDTDVADGHAASGGGDRQPDNVQLPDTIQPPPVTAQPSDIAQVPDNTQQPCVVQQSVDGGISPVSSDLSFLAVGDIMLGRNVGKKLEKAAGGYDYAFGGVSDILKKGDIVFANLEDPITSSAHGLDSKKKIVLKAKPEAVEALKSGGFNLLSIANNHMLDYYDTGLFDTMTLLGKNGIAFAGGGKDLDEARKPVILEKKGLKIGLLCYTDMAQIRYAGNPSISFAADSDKAGLAPRELESIKEDIAKLRGSVDILAVSLHWGVEDTFTPTPEQVDFARKLVDAGADLILGHHPHRFQGIEIYKGKPIIYSMGNFMFDQNDSEGMESFILDMEYAGNRLESFTATPVRIMDKSHVEVQKGADAQNILTREVGLCEKLGTDAETENDTLVFNLK